MPIVLSWKLQVQVITVFVIWEPLKIQHLLTLTFEEKRGQKNFCVDALDIYQSSFVYKKENIEPSPLNHLTKHIGLYISERKFLENGRKQTAWYHPEAFNSFNIVYK